MSSYLVPLGPDLFMRDSPGRDPRLIEVLSPWPRVWESFTGVKRDTNRGWVFWAWDRISIYSHQFSLETVSTPSLPLCRANLWRDGFFLPYDLRETSKKGPSRRFPHTLRHKEVGHAAA